MGVNPFGDLFQFSYAPAHANRLHINEGFAPCLHIALEFGTGFFQILNGKIPVLDDFHPSGLPKMFMDVTESQLVRSDWAVECFDCLHCFHQSKHRSEEHTSELQSRENFVCSLLLEKKKTARL